MLNKEEMQAFEDFVRDEEARIASETKDNKENES